jgi:hypothetical protein
MANDVSIDSAGPDEGRLSPARATIPPERG